MSIALSVSLEVRARPIQVILYCIDALCDIVIMYIYGRSRCNNDFMRCISISFIDKFIRSIHGNNYYIYVIFAVLIVYGNSSIVL